jgi:hypothetical protein
VVSEGSLRIDNIFISNPLEVPVEVAFIDNSEIPVLNMTVGAFSSEGFRGTWIADNGLVILSLLDANVVVTILHTTEGA